VAVVVAVVVVEHVSLVDDIAGVGGPGGKSEDVLIGVVSKVVVIAISVWETLGASKPDRHVNFRYKEMVVVTLRFRLSRGSKETRKGAYALPVAVVYAMDI
jgi:hypothetical protein